MTFRDDLRAARAGDWPAGKGGAGIGYDRIRYLKPSTRTARSGGGPQRRLDLQGGLGRCCGDQLAERPLVVGRIGGRAGGGASLTEDGRRFLRSVQFMQYELRRLAQRLGPEFGKDIVLPALSLRSRCGPALETCCCARSPKQSAPLTRKSSSTSRTTSARRHHHRRERQDPRAEARNGSLRAD